MNPLLKDLYGHQEWADAEHWRAMGACEAARGDATIRLRQLHVHLVQRFFMFACGDGQAPPTTCIRPASVRRWRFTTGC